MVRDDFLRQLSYSLYGLSEVEINDIILDYEKHFQIGLSQGKTEEEISNELGNPWEIAKNYINQTLESFREEPPTTNHNNKIRKVFFIILLGLFNLIIVLVPYIGLVGILLGIFGLGAGLFFTGIGILFGIPFVSISDGQLHGFTIIGYSLGFVGLGILIVLLGIYLAKLLYNLTARYIRCCF